MHKSFTITYYHSNLIPEMLFASDNDAEIFDTLLADFINNPKGRKEWEESCKGYPSPYAVAYNIENHDFELVGEFSDTLICEGCENMIAGYNGLQDDDCYRPVYRYIWSQLEPEVYESAYKSLNHIGDE